LKDHLDRDAQFAHINVRVTQALGEGQPVISVDTKKKELVGDVVAIAPASAATRCRRCAGVQKPASADDGAAVPFAGLAVGLEAEASARPQDQPHSGGRTAQTMP
jgi:hypothetical protein